MTWVNKMKISLLQAWAHAGNQASSLGLVYTDPTVACAPCSMRMASPSILPTNVVSAKLPTTVPVSSAVPSRPNSRPPSWRIGSPTWPPARSRSRWFQSSSRPMCKVRSNCWRSYCSSSRPTKSRSNWSTPLSVASASPTSISRLLPRPSSLAFTPVSTLHFQFDRTTERAADINALIAQAVASRSKNED